MTHDAHDISQYQAEKITLAEDILGYQFKDKQLLASAITHPSAIDGGPVQYSYERLEFLGDAVLGAIVSAYAFTKYPDLDEGGLTRIKVSLVSGTSLSDLAQSLGFEKIIVFGSSEAGTHGRGMHSALENVYEAVVAALFLDGGISQAQTFIEKTLIPKMSISQAQAPTNPKSELQEKLQEDGITPVYKIVETQGPPHDRTFVSQVFADGHALAKGSGRSKKEAESQAAKSTLARLSEFFGIGQNAEAKAKKEQAQAQARAKKEAQKKQRAKANKEDQAAKRAKKAQRQTAAKEAKEKKASARASKEQERKRQQSVWESDMEKVRSNSAREALEASQGSKSPNLLSSPNSQDNINKRDSSRDSRNKNKNNKGGAI